AILSNESYHFACRDGEFDGFQRRYARKPFRDSRHLKHALSVLEETLEVSAEKARDILLDVFPRDTAPIRDEQFIGIGQNASDRSTAASPLVDHLLQDARIGVLGNETHAEHLEPHACDLFDQRRIVQEPPASERQQARKLSRVDA